LYHFQLRKFQNMKIINRKKFRELNLTDEERNDILEMDKFISEKITEISRELNITYI